MREPIRDKGRLLHMIDAIDTILGRTKEMTYEDRVADKVFFGGIVYYTMIIGEASYKLSKVFKDLSIKSYDGEKDCTGIVTFFKNGEKIVNLQ